MGYPGITTLLEMWDRGWLGAWASRITVEHVQALLSRGDTAAVLAMDPRRAFAAVRMSRARSREGGLLHKACERALQAYQTGRDLTQLPKTSQIEKFIAWVELHQPTVLGIERTYVCHVCKYSARTDLELVLGNASWILDLKTGEGGVWNSGRLQLVAQAHAAAQPQRLDSHDLAHFIGSSKHRIGILWVHPSAAHGCEVIPVANDQATERAVQSLATLFHWHHAYKTAR